LECAADIFRVSSSTLTQTSTALQSDGVHDFVRDWLLARPWHADDQYTAVGLHALGHCNLPAETAALMKHVLENKRIELSQPTLTSWITVSGIMAAPEQAEAAFALLYSRMNTSNESLHDEARRQLEAIDIHYHHLPAPFSEPDSSPVRYPESFCYEHVIRAHARAGSVDECVSWFHRFERDLQRPVSVEAAIALNTCLNTSENVSLESAQKLLDTALSKTYLRIQWRNEALGEDLNPVKWSSERSLTLDDLSKDIKFVDERMEGSEAAGSLNGRRIHLGVNVINTYIWACARAGRINTASKTIQRMLKIWNRRPNMTTWVSPLFNDLRWIEVKKMLIVRMG
jgi:pentatricopeptide repeat protein